MGGIPVFVDTYPDFTLREESLRKALTDKTKMIIINSPNNPTGAVYSPEELKMVAHIAKENDLLVLSDDIYDKYLYETAKTQLEQAELNLQYATITSPFSGVITSRLVDQGEMIRVGTVMFLLADMDKLLARIYVPEKELARISLGNRVRLESEMFPGETFSGLVEMISPVVDPTTGTVKVTVHVSEDRDKLKPGTFCSAYILTETHENSLAISRKALVPDVEDTEVYVVEDGRVARLRKITVGIEQGDTLEVLAGLEDGDQVVLVGKEALRDGSPVKLINQESAGESSAPLPERPSPRRKAARDADGPRTR